MSWCGIKIVLPDDEAKDLLRYIEERFYLKQIDEDWCTLKRKIDNSVVDYYPIEPPKDRKIGW